MDLPKTVITLGGSAPTLSSSTAIGVLTSMGMAVYPVSTSLNVGGKATPISDYVDDCHVELLRNNPLVNCIYARGIISAEEAFAVNSFIKSYKNNAKLCVLNPSAYGENSPYDDDDFLHSMKTLTNIVDVIILNEKTAKRLLLIDHKQSFSLEIWGEIAGEIAKGQKNVVITGIDYDDYVVSVIPKKTGLAQYVKNKRVETSFNGCGELLSAIVVGELLRGEPLEIATLRGSNFIQTVLNNLAKSVHNCEGIIPYQGFLNMLGSD